MKAAAPKRAAAESAPQSTTQSTVNTGFEAFDQLATMVALINPQGQCLLANPLTAGGN